MKFGFITTEGGTYFKEALEEAVYGEELGFDSVWLEEHHSIRNHYWPSPLMALAGIATRAHHRTTAAHPERTVGILGEHQVMRAVAGGDVLHLLRPRVVHRQLAARAGEWEELR